MKRSKPTEFKVHAFVTDTEAVAVDTTKLLSRITNEVFAKLRHVTRILEAQRRKAEAAPAVAARRVVPDEEQPWFHGKLSRKQAEQLLLGANMTNGLFLVRQSDRTETDYALSFCYNRVAYHNRLVRKADGFYNGKGHK